MSFGSTTWDAGRSESACAGEAGSLTVPKSLSYMEDKREYRDRWTCRRAKSRPRSDIPNRRSAEVDDELSARFRAASRLSDARQSLVRRIVRFHRRSEEHTSELQSLMR